MAQGNVVLTSPNGPYEVRLENDASGHWHCHVQGGQNGGRFLEIRFAEGGIELLVPGSITINTGLTLDENGHAVFQLA